VNVPVKQRINKSGGVLQEVLLVCLPYD